MWNSSNLRLELKFGLKKEAFVRSDGANEYDRVRLVIVICILTRKTHSNIFPSTLSTLSCFRGT